LLIITVSLFLFVWYSDPRWERNISSNFVYLNASILLTLIQINAIILTGLLIRQVIYGLNDFENVIADITFNRIGKRPTPFAKEQSSLYREVRRAARYGRPLSVIALKVEEENLQVALPKMVKEVQQAMMKEYTLAGIARILDENLLSFDIIALRDDHFVVALPETVPESTIRIAQRLQKAVEEKMGMPLYVGTASFPDEAMTFEALVERAIENASQQSPQQLQLVYEKNEQTIAHQEV
jgi:hypothetical protein